MSTGTLVQRLATASERLRSDGMTSELETAAVKRVLDIVGLELGALELPTSAAAIGFAADQGGREDATVFGLWDRKVPAAQAAFVGGVLAHSLDFDDTHLPSVLHPSASIVPAALAVAEQVAASGRELLTAVTAGIEVCVRLGMAGYDREAGTSTFFERGQHATSICGAVGAAAAAALLRGLTAEGIADAMGLAVSMAGGVIEANRTGGTVKRMHCGWAAHAGVIGAELAARGFTGPPTVLEGRFGFFQAYLSGRYDEEAITSGLGSDWAVTSLHDKPYPANHFTHAVADAAIRLRADGVTGDDIAAVHIGVPTPIVRTVGDPIEAKRRPESGYHAKFSAPYVFTAALFGGGGLGLGHDDFTDELVRQPARQALMDRISVSGDAQCDALYPQAFPAIVGVTLVDGSTRVEQVLQMRGSPDRPLSESELQAKFTGNAERSLPAALAQELAASVLDLPRHPSVTGLFDLLKELAASASIQEQR